MAVTCLFRAIRRAGVALEDLLRLGPCLAVIATACGPEITARRGRGIAGLFVPGVLLVAEDGDDMQLIGIRPDNTLMLIAQCTGHTNSEITGPAFSPDGQRLYFNSQRGPTKPVSLALGVTYEITGPFDQLLDR